MAGALSLFARVAAGGLLAAACCAAQGQPEFEAAVIKPAAPPVMGRMMIRMAGGPGSGGDPAQINYVNVSLKMVLANVFNVKNFQISGPDWLDSDRFDITAKIAPGATPEQFRQMLQNLLAERFHLKVHHDTKEMAMLALVVGKNGPKMPESKVDSAAPEGKNPFDGGPGAPPPPPPDGGRGMLHSGPDGMPKMPPGMKGNRMMIMNGKVHMDANGETMAAFAQLLSNQLGTPVEDHTGLTKQYDISLDFVPDFSKMMGGGMPMPMMHADGPGGGSGGGGGEAAGAASEPSGPTLEAAVQQLGLKLEKSKGKADFVIVDSMDKTPTGN